MNKMQDLVEIKTNYTKSCGCLRKGNMFDYSNNEFVIMRDNKGRECLLEWDDVERAKNYTWYRKSDNYWVGRVEGKDILLHRFLMSVKQGEVVDHINNFVFDNRKANLRICNHQQNMCNAKKREGCTSIYKGVSWNKRANRWVCRIRVNGKLLYLGYFDDEISAGLKYNEEAKKRFGEFAKLNTI